MIRYNLFVKEDFSKFFSDDDDDDYDDDDVNAIAPLSFNTNNTANFPTLCLFSFKQTCYYSNRMWCFAINKEDNAMVINAKRSTLKKANNTHTHTRTHTHTYTHTLTHTLP